MRRVLKASAWTLGSLLALSLILVCVVLLIGSTSAGRRYIETLTARLTSGHVMLTGLAGSFPQHLTLDKLELSDKGGVWLSAEKIQLDWSPAAFLGRRLKIDHLQVAHLDMERLPLSEPTSSSSEPSLPRIDVLRAELTRVDLGAALAGMPAALTAKGSFVLRSLRDMRIDVDAQRLASAGNYQVHLRFEPKQMSASVKISEPADGPLENILRVPGLGTLVVTANMSGPRSAERFDLSLNAGSLSGQANGILDLDKLGGDFDFAFESKAMEPQPEVKWQKSTLQGRWHGSFKSPTADARFEVRDLKVPGGTSLASFAADLAAIDGAATMRADLRGLKLPLPQQDLLAAEPIRIDASIRLDDKTLPLELTASHRLFALKMHAVPVGERNATFELKLPLLEPLARLAEQEIRGSAVVTGKLGADAHRTRGSAVVALALEPGAQAWAPLLGPRATIRAAATFKDKMLSVDELKLNGKLLSIDAEGSYGAPVLRSRYDVTLSDLSALSAAVAGTLAVKGTANGNLNALNVEARASANLSVHGSTAGVVTADVKATGLPKAPSGSLIVQGNLDDAPLSVNVAFERSGAGALHTIVHQADWKSAHAQGDLSMAIGESQVGGRINLQIAQLSDLQHLVGVPLGGSVSATLDAHQVGQTSQARLHLDARELAFDQFVANARLSGEGDLNAFAFDADADTQNLLGAPATVKTSGTLNLGARALTLAALAARVRGQDLALLAPTHLNFNEGVAVDELRLGTQQAELEVQGRLAPELALRANLRNVRPQLINAFVPDLLSAGSMNAHADLRGDPAAPNGNVVLNATGIKFADDNALGLPAANLHGTVQLQGNSTQIDAAVEAGPNSNVRLTGRAPFAQDGALDLKFSGGLDVGLANVFLEARGERATGKLSIDATVTGTVSDPRIGGAAKLTQGSLHDYGRGLSLTDIGADLSGDGGRLVIDKLTATATPGTLSVTGSIGVLQKGVPIDLKLTARRAQPLVSKLLTSNMDADITVKGTALARLDVAGKINLNRTVIGVPNTFPPNVAVLDVRRRGVKKVPTANQALVVGLDIQLHAPSQILVQGRGLDAELSGDIGVGGTTDAPQVTGGFELVSGRGSFTLAGSRLDLKEGHVTFEGSGLKNRIDPSLDFTAQTVVQGTTAILRITGLADSPRFDFSSDPPLPPDEVLARLLFGTSNVAQLTAIQYAEIASALATLSGVGGDGTLNPLVKIQKSLGLDRLSLGSGTTNAAGESQGASIAAGRYISKRVYLEAKQTTTGTSQIEADIDITKRLKLQTKLGNGATSVQGTTPDPDNDPGSSLGLSYQFEY